VPCLTPRGDTRPISGGVSYKRPSPPILSKGGVIPKGLRGGGAFFNGILKGV